MSSEIKWARVAELKNLLLWLYWHKELPTDIGQFRYTVPTPNSLLSKQIHKKDRENHKQQHQKASKQTNDKKRQEEGNRMDEETEIQKSETAFHQEWEKQVINSPSLRLYPLLVQWCYPTSLVAKVRKTGKSSFGASRHFLCCHNRILNITKSPRHYDKTNTLNLFNWLISIKQNKRKEMKVKAVIYIFMSWQ